MSTLMKKQGSLGLVYHANPQQRSAVMINETKKKILARVLSLVQGVWGFIGSFPIDWDRDKEDSGALQHSSRYRKNI
jgi:sensor domain CHASE-containing protein